MKVKVEFTLDIDPQAWSMEYGIEGTKAIRQDVKEYAAFVAYEQFRENGLILDRDNLELAERFANQDKTGEGSIDDLLAEMHTFKPYADIPDLCVAELHNGDTCNQSLLAHKEV